MQQTEQPAPEAVEAALEWGTYVLESDFLPGEDDTHLAVLMAAARAGQEARRALAEIDQLRPVAKLEVIGGPEHTECHVIGWFSRPAGLYGAKEAVGTTFTAALRALGAMLAKTKGGG